MSVSGRGRPATTDLCHSPQRNRLSLGAAHLVQCREPQEVTTKTSLSYNLIAVYKDSKNRWNFEFENGDVWQQIEPGYLPKPKNLPVRVDISDGVFGSHDLRAENFGKPVKVKRIK